MSGGGRIILPSLSGFDPAKAENVILKKDVTLGMTRTEVICAKCEGHLGHVFEGEGFNTPTDQRYCINGGGLIYVPAKEDKKEPEKAEKSEKSEKPAKEDPEKK
ncbi:MAG: hypothetical protein EOP84_30395 [Verrucomicrobiaceae bacterium]|nr:MAG: hypothetical protein EOP84_30395 [Verrucomicrobiaceae bacterium]